MSVLISVSVAKRQNFTMVIAKVQTHEMTDLLPPTNEVWGKVMFLHLSVILFTGECIPACSGQGVCIPTCNGAGMGVCLWVYTPLGRHPPDTHPLPEETSEVGGTHPTGMHSCSLEWYHEQQKTAQFDNMNLWYNIKSTDWDMCLNSTKLSMICLPSKSKSVQWLGPNTLLTTNLLLRRLRQLYRESENLGDAIPICSTIYGITLHVKIADLIDFCSVSATENGMKPTFDSWKFN